MSRREFRPKRWEQKANVRPGKRARMYRYTEYDMQVSYERGIVRGTKDTAERSRRRDELLYRLSQAAEQGQDALEELARELDQEDDLVDVADAAGVTPEDPVVQEAIEHLMWNTPDVGDQAEQWLADRTDWLRWLREQGPED